MGGLGLTELIVVAVTFIVLATIGTSFVFFLVRMALRAEKDNDLGKIIAAQQTQIDDLKRELEKMKRNDKSC